MNLKTAKTPPLGWNSWDCFGAAVTEAELLANAEYMAENLAEFGWQYIVCDIQWYEPNAKDNDYNNFTELTMDGFGRLLPAVNRFPSAAGGQGFKPIADKLHAMGLKFGIHILRGIPRAAVHQNLPIKGTSCTARDAAHHFSVCSWNTDMYGMRDCEAAQAYYDSILELYAAWGVDFIKCDDMCITEFRQWDEPYSARREIEMLRSAMDRCGRDMVLSLSPGPALREEAKHLAKYAEMWRLTGDFWDEWPKLYNMFDRCEEWQGVPRPGAWCDCDMLPMGRISKNGACHGEQNRMTNFTKPEQVTMMTLWGIFQSPLMFGGNLPENDRFTQKLLTNRRYLAMHREAYGARELLRDNAHIVWTACGRGKKYLAMFNLRPRAKRMDVDLTQILMPDTAYTAHDIWQGSEETVQNKLTCEVDAHGAALFEIF